METFLIDYRDPLFGIIVLFAIIFIIAISNYWFEVFKKKDDDKNIDNYIRKFEITKADTNYKNIFKDSTLSADNILLIAFSYEKIGEFEKAINLLLFSLQKDIKKEQKQHILYSLGKLYFKAGFLQKAQESFISSLKLSPRDKNSLKYLSVVYEKQFKLDEVCDILSAREELSEDVLEEICYIQSLKILQNSNLNDEKKADKLITLSKNSITIQRLCFEFLVANNLLHTIENDTFNFENLTDLIWQLDKTFFNSNLLKNQTIQSIALAKGFIKQDIKESNLFELNLLAILNATTIKHNATLDFEYLCCECKQVLPIEFSRCPHCQSINSLKINLLLSKEH
jgi:lipopolysaccharide biosynthesis regulator YciM